MLRTALTVLTASLLALGTLAQAADLTHTKDSLETVKAKVAEKKAIMVDVRSQDEWDEGHVKGAVHYPIAELQGKVDMEKLKEKLPKDKVLFTYCGAGVRSLKAGKILKDLGYDVRPLKPGYEEIAKAGWETEKKPAQPAEPQPK